MRSVTGYTRGEMFWFVSKQQAREVNLKEKYRRSRARPFPGIEWMKKYSLEKNEGN